MSQISDFEKGEIVRAAVKKCQVTEKPLTNTAWRVFAELEDRGFVIVQREPKNES